MPQRAPQWQRRVLTSILNHLEAEGDPGMAEEVIALGAWLERPTKTASSTSRKIPSKPKDPPELVAAKRVVRARSRGLCEMGGPHCTGVADRAHHTAGRGFKGCHDPKLLLDCCQACHDYAHAEPKISYAKGWMVHRHGVHIDAIIAAALEAELTGGPT